MSQTIQSTFWSIVALVSFGLVRKQRRSLVPLVLSSYGFLALSAFLIYFGANKPPF